MYMYVCVCLILLNDHIYLPFAHSANMSYIISFCILIQKAEITDIINTIFCSKILNQKSFLYFYCLNNQND